MRLKKRKTAIKIKLDQNPQGGQYGALNPANSDNTYYYVRGNVLHVVCAQMNTGNLYDYTLKSNETVKSKKKIKLCKHDLWGGMYYGEDGYIYVVVGYSNLKHSRTKTVMKVMKYSALWKLQKTCAIKGDAYERGINITVVKNYGKSNAATKDILPFKIKGKTGNNYTGLTLGGVETTVDNVLTVGTSVPQDYKVAGVTGNNVNYAKNVFLTITYKDTLKSKIKWLTNYNPKKSKVVVGEVRTIKLSDDAIVVMYTTTYKSKSTLHYLVLNNQGNVICTKTYKNMEFTASSQPILYNGAINWVDAKYTYKKVKWNKQTFWDHKESHYYYRIPAVVK